MIACRLPSSSTACRTALIRVVSADSLTKRSPQISSSSSCFRTTLPRRCTRYARTSKALGSSLTSRAVAPKHDASKVQLAIRESQDHRDHSDAPGTSAIPQIRSVPISARFRDNRRTWSPPSAGAGPQRDVAPEGRHRDAAVERDHVAAISPPRCRTTWPHHRPSTVSVASLIVDRVRGVPLERVVLQPQQERRSARAARRRRRCARRRRGARGRPRSARGPSGCRRRSARPQPNIG